MASWAQKKRLVDPKAAKQLTAEPKTTRNFSWKPEAIEKFAQEHPDLAIREGDNLMLAEPLGEQLTIHYVFDDVEALRRNFAPMLEKIESAASSGGYNKIYLNFDDHPNRTFIEPVIRQSALEPVYEFVYLLREDLSSMSPLSEVRPASSGDVEAVVALDRACYEGAPLGHAAVSELVGRDDELLVLEENGQVVGYVHARQEGELTGHIARLGVRPEQRHEGKGYTLMTAALGHLAGKGCIRATTLAPVEHKAAVDLCRKAGFVPWTTVIRYAKDPGAKPKKTRGLIGLRGIWER